MAFRGVDRVSAQKIHAKWCRFIFATSVYTTYREEISRDREDVGRRWTGTKKLAVPAWGFDARSHVPRALTERATWNASVLVTPESPSWDPDGFHRVI